jgi:hypothetical protein
MKPTNDELRRLAEIATASRGMAAANEAEKLYQDFLDWEDYEDEPPYVVTRETIDQWIESEAEWIERSTPTRHIDGIFWPRVQVLAGQRRKSIAVVAIDGGTVVYSQNV